MDIDNYNQVHNDQMDTLFFKKIKIQRIKIKRFNYLYHNVFHTNQNNKNIHMDQLNKLINLYNNHHHLHIDNHNLDHNNQMDNLYFYFKLFFNKYIKHTIFTLSSIKSWCTNTLIYIWMIYSLIITSTTSYLYKI